MEDSLAKYLDGVGEVDPSNLLSPRRKITGMSAILLPFQDNGNVDWEGFEAHVKRTLSCGLIPAVNMDTGFGNLLDTQTKKQVLERTRNLASGKKFVAGAFVADSEGAEFQRDAYFREVEAIQEHEGLPIIVQSFGLAHQSADQIIAHYAEIGKAADQFLAFELSTQFAPFGRIYDLETYWELLKVKQCIGAKHSSLSRIAEWQRLRLRNEVRPHFQVLTGNDLAIDMVKYGSDYLLGLSTFAPEAFALRDKCWEEGLPEFYEINDTLQFLGHFAFRRPVPAYKHSAAMFLKLRGWIASETTHPKSPQRPASDLPVLKEILDMLDAQCNSCPIDLRSSVS